MMQELRRILYDKKPDSDSNHKKNNEKEKEPEKVSSASSA
jgi:hypothetical protein